MNYDDYTPEELEVLKSLKKRAELFNEYNEEEFEKIFKHIRELSRAGLIDNDAE